MSTPAPFQIDNYIPECSEHSNGECYEPFGSRGVVIYNNYLYCQDSDILVPGFSLLPRWILGGVYILFMAYLFIGVSIAADVFMSAIEVITATTRKVKRKDQNGNVVMIDVPVWNWVIANISLMAVGSSIPEIMLSLVETILNLGGEPGELGASTIVGSGSFNLFVIIAICTVAIPDGKFKKIEQFRVYVCTSLISLWAHIWLLVVYEWWTPNEVTLAEAWITLGQFPVLLITAWCVDTKPWEKKNNIVQVSPDPEITAEKEGADKDLVVNVRHRAENGEYTSVPIPALGSVTSTGMRNARKPCCCDLAPAPRTAFLDRLPTLCQIFPRPTGPGAVPSVYRHRRRYRPSPWNRVSAVVLPEIVYRLCAACELCGRSGITSQQ